MTDDELRVMGFKPSAELTNRWYMNLHDGTHIYVAQGAGDYWSFTASGNGDALKNVVAKFKESGTN